MILEVCQFLAANARALDRGDFEGWLDGFREDARYRVVTTENLELGHDLPLMLATNKDMLRDRIVSLREANIYNIHTDRHVIGLPIVESKGDLVFAETSVAVFQTDQEGVSTLFCVGSYRDELAKENGGLVLQSRDVVIDTAGILRLLSTPL